MINVTEHKSLPRAVSPADYYLRPPIFMETENTAQRNLRLQLRWLQSHEQEMDIMGGTEDHLVS